MNRRDYQKRKRRQQRRRRRRNMLLRTVVIVVTIALLCVVAFFVAKKYLVKDDGTKTTSLSGFLNKDDSNLTEEEKAAKEEEAAQESEEARQENIVAQADIAAAMYDYDKAITMIKEIPGYDTNPSLMSKISSYEATKATCTPWPIDQVTHVFYHSLIKDPSKSFDGDARAAGYNQYMTTIDEYNKITQSMYEKGFVLVSMPDISPKDENGVMTKGEILLPPGKKPFVLSIDDVSYYHYMKDDGYASKLIIDENGDIKNEYVEDDGSISIGDYDVVPLLDTFVKEHPDFSYRGAKGTLAMTGYNGLLGYRTDITYIVGPDTDKFQLAWLEENPDFDLEEERAKAREVVEVMKANGWIFASHTWGHQNATTASLETLQADWQRWKESCTPVLGEVDTLIFAFGADIGDYGEYSGAKFDFYHSEGISYFANVNGSAIYWEQFNPLYFRQGRRNLDGYRMWYNPDMCSDLFNVDEVFDPVRPTPVAPME